MTVTPQAAPIATQVAAARAAFDSGRTRPLPWRRAQLDALIRMMTVEGGRIEQALQQDLGRPAVETRMAEILTVLQEAAGTRRNLRRWTRDRQVGGGTWVVGPSSAAIHREPLGVVLILSPWNYPFRLTLMPLIGSLAAGNTAVVKPSELAPASSQLMAELLPRYLDPDAVQVVLGGADEAGELLRHRFDHILFTGNGRVGRIVMEAAARQLTPVTLELGGRSPVWVDHTVDLTAAARSIAWGKFGNAGQACVAPDHVLTTPDLAPRLADALADAVTLMYGDLPSVSPDFGRIVNTRHTRRLAGLLGSGRVITGGQVDVDARYVAPTVLLDPAPDSPVLAGEIFGPVLPVVSVADLDAAVRQINDGGKPLVLYAYTHDRAVRDALQQRTSSGALVFNTVVAHLGVRSLPFGGVGASGMGAYHGEHSLRTFSHERAVLRKTWGPDLTTFVRPPFVGPSAGIAERVIKLS